MVMGIDLTNKNILILGYALTGRSAAEFLLDQGSQITINDRGDLSQDPSVQLLIERGAKVVDQGHPLSLLEKDWDMIIKNPGIPYSLEVIVEAEKLGIPIYTDVEVASWFIQGKLIGITGSNGKTTTTQLIYNLIKGSQTSETHLAGNIGIPFLDVVPDARPEDQVVVELSSFQLMGTQYFHPHIAVITNIYESHLDYHGNRDNYVAAKLKLVDNLTADDFIIYRYNGDNGGELHGLLRECKGQKVPFSVDPANDYLRANGAYVEDGGIYFKGNYVLSLSQIHIPGSHNVENVLAAIAVASIYGVEKEQIQEIIEQFAGMPHRIQEVLNDDGIRYFNDSKATNMTATITALQSFTDPIRYIGGGLDRGNEFDELKPYLTDIQSAHLYGETAEKMARVFCELEIETTIHDNLDQATKAAYQRASSGQVVLFSPACASWDQYKNFEIRGDHFVEVIHSLVKDGGK